MQSYLMMSLGKVVKEKEESMKLGTREELSFVVKAKRGGSLGKDVPEFSSPPPQEKKKKKK